MHLGFRVGGSAAARRVRLGFRWCAGVGQRLVELFAVQSRFVERIAAAAVRQREFGRDPDVVNTHGLGTPPGRVGHRGAGHHQIGTHPVDVEGGAQGRDPAQLVVAEDHVGDPVARGGDPVRQSGLLVGVPGGERGRVGFVRHPRADHLGAHVDLPGGADVDGQAEPVEQLRAQLALFGVHRADQHETGLVGMRYAVALDVHAAHRGGVEQNVHQVVVQQVHLVDVEHAAVGAGQQTGREGVLTDREHLLQVQRPDHPVLGGADGQFDQARVADGLQHPGQTAHRGRLGGALLAADQHAADLRADRAQDQRQPQLVMADDRGERKGGVHGVGHAARPGRTIGTCGMPSSRNSAPSGTNPCRPYISAR